MGDSIPNVELPTRRQVSQSRYQGIAGLRRDAKGGPWDTGIVEHDGEFLIFANIGISGRTGDDYDNRLEDGLLHWYHKRRSRITWPSVQRLLEPMKVIHVFWRTSGRDPFEYAGQATPVRVFEETSPVEVLWSFAHPLLEAEMFVGPMKYLQADIQRGTSTESR